MKAVDYQTYVLPTGALVRTPSSLNSLSKVSKNSRRNSSIVDILRCYVDEPPPQTAIRGHNIINTDSEHQNKVKYHTTFSCSLSTKPDSIDTYSNSVVAAVTNSAHAQSETSSMSKRQTNTASYRIEPKQACYSYSGQSVNSELPPVRKIHSSQFSDEFFDSLDIPGHFNTRGLYGQKANISTPLLTRSHSEVNLFHLDFIRAKKQTTSFDLRLPSTERGLNYLRSSRRNIGQDEYSKYMHKLKTKQKSTVSRKTRNEAGKESKLNKKAHNGSFTNIPKLEPSQDVLKVGNTLNSSRKLKIPDSSIMNHISVSITQKNTMETTANKRQSVDVSTQTLLGLDDETDYDLI